MGKKGKQSYITLHIKTTGALATRNGARTNYRLSVQPAKTWGHVMAKIRHMIKASIEPAEALFLFVGTKQIIPAMSATVGSYNKPIIRCTICIESAFGSWDKIYQRSSIDQLGENCFIATIYYKYYWWTEYTESKYCATLELARAWILEQRTNKCLVETTKQK